MRTHSELEVSVRLAGKGVDSKNLELVKLLEDLELSRNVKLFGQLDNMEEFYRSLDVHCLISSYGEGFPNVVAESMLCSVPNIVTDVGDSALIVGSTGWIIPVGCADELAEKFKEIMTQKYDSSFNSRKIAAEKLIKENYSIQKMVDNYNAVWEQGC